MVVAKVGGTVLKGGLAPDLAHDIKHVLSDNRVVLVHGGGIEVTEIASRLGKEQRFIVSPTGFRSRYTDRETAQIYTMVMAGMVNKQIVSILQRNGVPAVGLSGLDGLLIQAERKKRLIVVDERGRRRAIDGGYTGRIVAVNAPLLRLLIEEGYTPVVAPVAISGEFEPLNVDGDRTAAYVAGALKADRLVLLTDVGGVTLNGELVPKLSVAEVKEVLPKIGPGMITKVYAATEALGMGVGEVVIASGFERSPISSSLKHGFGTVITNE
ncbi:MAG: [LysW]-aminoadipate/[LysW]-glutamate kinase [Candidatus Bathyarchaeia archaeon]